MKRLERIAVSEGGGKQGRGGIDRRVGDTEKRERCNGDVEEENVRVEREGGAESPAGGR